MSVNIYIEEQLFHYKGFLQIEILISYALDMGLLFLLVQRLIII